MIFHVDGEIFTTFDEASEILGIAIHDVERLTQSRYFKYRGFAEVWIDFDVTKECFVEGVFEAKPCNETEESILKDAHTNLYEYRGDDGCHLDHVHFVMFGCSYEPCATWILNGDRASKSECLEVKFLEKGSKPEPHLNFTQLARMNDDFGFVNKRTFDNVMHSLFDDTPGMIDSIGNSRSAGDLIREWSPFAGPHEREVGEGAYLTAETKAAPMDLSPPKQKELSSARKTENLLRTVGALVLLLHKKGPPAYSRGDLPNKSEIARRVEAQLAELDLSTHGQGKSTLAAVINQALDLLAAEGGLDER